MKKKEKKIEIFFLIFFSIFKNVRFPDSPDFENLPDFRTGRDVR